MRGLADSLIARIVKQRDLLQAMDEHCRSVAVRVTSRDQSVSVEVDGRGAMTGLWLAPNAYRNGADELAKLIVDTAQAAAKHAMDRQQFLLKEFQARLRELQEQPLTRWDGTTVRPS
jgi:DNA-binding protein YbaB